MEIRVHIGAVVALFVALFLLLPVGVTTIAARRAPTEVATTGGPPTSRKPVTTITFPPPSTRPTTTTTPPPPEPTVTEPATTEAPTTTVAQPEAGPAPIDTTVSPSPTTTRPVRATPIARPVTTVTVAPPAPLPRATAPFNFDAKTAFAFAAQIETAYQLLLTSPPTTPPPPVDPGDPLASLSEGDRAFMLCVRNRESHGNYSVVNSSSGAAGAYQFMPATWDITAAHAGRPDLIGTRANLASPYTQDLMAVHLLTWYGRSPWAGPGCY